MPKVKVGDINMYYEIHGQGEPLVFIDGNNMCHELLYRHVPVFAREFKVISYDNRGVGKSDKPDTPYSIKMMADDMAGLLKKIGIDRAHIYGSSMGGMIAQEFTLSYPEMVKMLILSATSPGGPNAIALNKSKRFDREARAKMSDDELGDITLHLCVTQKYIDEHPDFVKEIKAGVIKSSQPAYAALRQAEATRQGYNTYDRLPQIKVPTLVMTGDCDDAVPYENSKIIASRIPAAELVIFKGAGHILVEAGEEPHRKALEFLKKHRK